MSRAFAAALVTLCGSVCGAQQRAAREFRWIDSIVQSQSASQHLPGVAVAVVKNGSPVLARGYGTTDLSTGRAVSATTPFNIASLTKPFTALMITQLVAERKVALDAPALRYLDWLPPQYAAITVRQLLHHTSGVVRDVRRDNADDPDPEEYRARVVSSVPSGAPGERFEYSNTGFTLLGWIVEAVESAPLERVFSKRLFEPFAMRQAAYRAPLAANPLRAQPYNVQDGKAAPVAYVSGGLGSGGLSMSITDMAAFTVALQRDRLLTSAWRDSAWTPGSLASGQLAATTMFGDTAGYGFGWFVATHAGRRVLTHGGGINGYSTMLLHFPAERLSIAVFANARAPVEAIARSIADECLRSDRCDADVVSPPNH